jgi:hypothetical protein
VVINQTIIPCISVIPDLQQPFLGLDSVGSDTTKELDDFFP